MKIAITHRDWRQIGGGELVINWMQNRLEAQGHRVTRLWVDVPTLSRTPYGVDIPDEMWHAHNHFFRYFSLHERFRQLDVSGFDAVIATQPPSFAIDHPRVMSLFLHHERIFYDLADQFVAAGFVDEESLRREQRWVHRADADAMADVKHFCANSETVQERLRVLSGIEGNVSVHHAASPHHITPAPRWGRGHIACVSRMEFPKRVELFVQAMKLLPGEEGMVVGGGSRASFITDLDKRFIAGELDARYATAAETWLNRGLPSGPPVSTGASNVELHPFLADAQLAQVYTQSLCIVAPAFEEDYGLTAVEAMAYGRPIVVCRDGGGLVDLVEDGVTGFVVEPSAVAIAAAVQRLRDAPQLLHTMSANALERSRQYTAESCEAEILAGLEATCS